MKIGAVFPQTEIGSNPAEIRYFAEEVEGMGMSYLLAYDHVAGANPDRPGGWEGPYDHEDPFHEPFTLFGFLAAVTTRLELVTGVLILPQRQTVLVAKQAAAVDVLSGGRLRLGVGVGWNKTEYQSLNKNFHDRGRRQEEQVDILRRLWTQPLVNYVGRDHQLPDIGILPRPLQQPIPIWFGGSSDATFRRMVSMGDGWIPNAFPLEQLTKYVDQVHRLLEDKGRDPTTFGIDYQIVLGDFDDRQLERMVTGLQQLGVTHVCGYTMNAGHSSVEDHLSALQRFFEIASHVLA